MKRARYVVLTPFPKCVEEAFGEVNDHGHQFQEIPFAAWLTAKLRPARGGTRASRKLQQRLQSERTVLLNSSEETLRGGCTAPVTMTPSALRHQRVVMAARHVVMQAVMLYSVRAN